jgi:hypothetical protein
MSLLLMPLLQMFPDELGDEEAPSDEEEEQDPEEEGV